MNLPAKLPAPLEKLIGDEEITGTRVVRFGETRIDGPTEFWRTFRFTVDGKTFDPTRVDQRVRLGAVEEWTIINDQPHDPEDHVFHIHTNDMLLTKINGEPLAEPDLAGHGDPPAQWQHHLPLALPRFHRQVHAPLPHDEP